MFDWLGTALDVAKTGAGIFSAISGSEALRDAADAARTPTPLEEASARALARSESLIDALTNPENETFKKLEAEQKTSARDALVNSINEIMSRNRRALQRGPVGLLVNQDRRDETVARALTEGYQNETEKARAKARAIIAQGLNPSISMGATAGTLGARQRQGNILGNAYDANASDALFRGVGSGIDFARNAGQRLFSNLSAGAASTDFNDPTALPNRQFGRGAYGMLGNI